MVIQNIHFQAIGQAKKERAKVETEEWTVI